jgi:hypothetical protein
LAFIENSEICEIEKMKKFAGIVISIITIIVYGCTKPYTPTSISTNANILVVEGFINTGADSTIIKLSRTVTITNKTTVNPETKSVVTVENAQGITYPLAETVKGTYVSPGLNLDNTKQYRIRIKTSSGKTYLSDLVNPKISPPIDSIGYTVTSAGVQIYTNTHDPNNNTRYYKYDFQETWQFHSAYQSLNITNGSAIVDRTPAQQNYFCFGNDYSTDILINSTAALSQDVVYQFPITSIPYFSEKIETKYSILLKQQALTSDAYAFWQNLRKNTEQLGGIFDAQPTELAGNIHNITDASEPVIGYMSAGTIQQKRIFIDRLSLPLSWKTAYPYTCSIDTNWFCNPKVGKPCQNDVALYLIPSGSSYVPLMPFFIGIAPTPTGYISSTIPCEDCTIRGAIKQPAFWR